MAQMFNIPKIILQAKIRDKFLTKMYAIGIKAKPS